MYTIIDNILVYNYIEVKYIMSIRYDKLFKLMEERGIKKYDLRKKGIHAAVVDKLIKNKTVDTTTINKLCELLNVQPEAILEYVPDEKEAP